MDIPILVHPKCKVRLAVDEAIRIINHHQAYFRLHIVEARWLRIRTRKNIDPEEIIKVVKRRYDAMRVLVVIENPLKGDVFDYPSKGVSIISTAEWEDNFAPPPTVIFLVFLFACSLATLITDMPDRQIELMKHDKLRGCIFDNTEGRREFRLGLVAAHLCAQCEGKLAEWGVLDRPIDAIVEILAYVREFVIRRPRSTPTYIFIGHGGKNDWEVLRDWLLSLNLEVDEFNVEPTAGMTTVEGLAEMLNRACFAILVMTAEDKQPDGRVNARQNVVHEIGLFQGKLGFMKSIIVKEDGADEFSNIKGLTYISYPKDKIVQAFPKIERVLIRERVLEEPVTYAVAKKASRST